MKPRKFAIQVDGYVERQPLFDLILEKLKDVFSGDVVGEFEEGRSFFGMWQITFTIPAVDHNEKNHGKVNALLRDIYNGNTGIRGFRTIWEEDRHQRMVEEAESDIKRFGTISFNLGEKWVKEIQRESESDD